MCTSRILHRPQVTMNNIELMIALRNKGRYPSESQIDLLLSIAIAARSLHQLQFPFYTNEVAHLWETTAKEQTRNHLDCLMAELEGPPPQTFSHVIAKALADAKPEGPKEQ